MQALQPLIPQVTGSTDVYLILGDPVEQVRASKKNIRGMWVTIPHKMSIMDVLDDSTPLGLKLSDPLPCDVAHMEPHAALVDILMKNQPTPLLRAARARGLVAQPGFEMMILQTHLYLDFFGFTDAAAAVRKDADFIRQTIYPT